MIGDMLEIRKFAAEDIKKIRLQNHDLLELNKLPDSFYKAVEPLESYSIFLGDKPIACVGIVQYWTGRGEVWAVIDRESGASFISLVRALEKLLSKSECTRIEATVIKQFVNGHRLAKILGFDMEASTMKKYGVTGLDYSLYARVK